jgi:hypothetical protein
MRRLVSSAFVTVLLMFLVIPAQAQDLPGTWVMTYARAARGGGEATEVTQEFIFAVDEAGVLGGTTMMAMRGGRGGAGGGAAPAPQEVKLSDVKFEDGTLTFAVNQTMGEQTMSTTYSAKVTGNTMEGTMTRGGGMGGRAGAATPTPTPFKAVKKEG